MPERSPVSSLQGLVARCNVEFGRRLLDVHDDDPLDFAHFVRVADRLVGEDPRRAALHLAGLVALDVANEDPPPPPAQDGRSACAN